MADTHYQLVVQKGPKVGQVYPLSSISITIGRDPMADIVISDPEVSRQHVRLTRTESGYQLQDLGSTNGTFIDGQRLTHDLVNLMPGQLIAMGSGVVLLYRVEGDEGDVAALATMAHASPGRPGEPPLPQAVDFEAGDFERYEEPLQRYEPDVRYRGTEPPPARRPESVYIPADANREQRRRNTIIATVILLILCCCCAFPLSGWYIWGDPLLELLRSLGVY